MGTINGIIQAEVEAGQDTQATSADIEQVLERHERYLASVGDNESAAQSEQRLGGNYLIGGTAAYKSGRYSRAVSYFERARVLLGKLGAGPEPLFAAASYAALGQTGAAKRSLKDVDNRRITNGIARSEFESCGEFESLRDDAEVIEMLASWTP